MLIAGPNLTIDRRSDLPRLRPGGVLRAGEVSVTPAGKGLNVARAARALGIPAVLVAFVPGHTGRATAALIAEEGVTLDAVVVGGEIASTAVIVDPAGATVIDEPRPPLAAGDWRALEATLDAALPDHDVLVCSGSLPPNSPKEGFGLFTRHARLAGCLTVVDAGGVALGAALAAHPAVVTPNLAEAEALLHGRADESLDPPPDARRRAEAAAAALVRAGAGAAIVTAAAAGAAVTADGETTWIAAPRVDVVRNPAGAGDVLTATVAAALETGIDVLTAARRGVAAAAASVERPRPGELDPARMAELLNQ
jgi:1-phosphofructokinase family hexose kinase